MRRRQNRLISQIDGLPVRKSGVWIRRKHFFLQRYLEIFSKGMGKIWKTVYIDLFAGPGRCEIEYPGNEADGSPLLALQYPFSDYIYVEQDPENFKALQQRCENSPRREDIQFIQGDCNQVVDKIHLEENELAFAFLDPSEANLHFETIRTLTLGKRVDILLNVPFGMDIKRGFNAYLKQRERSKLNKLLGGKVPWEKIEKPEDVIKLYEQRISELGFAIVKNKKITVKNSKNAPLYFLSFASKHARGEEFWKKIAKIDETGQRELF